MNTLSVSVRCFDVDGSGTDVDCGYPGEGTVGPAQEGKASRSVILTAAVKPDGMVRIPEEAVEQFFTIYIAWDLLV